MADPLAGVSVKLTVAPASAVPNKVAAPLTVAPAKVADKVGVAGAVLSTVMLRAGDNSPLTPLAEMTRAVTCTAPVAMVALGVKDQLPLAAAVVTPTTLPLTNTCTEPDAGAPMPVNVGRRLWVMPSLLLLPESLAALSTGALKAAGTVLSSTKASADDVGLVLPLASISTAVMLSVPVDKLVLGVKLQAPVVALTDAVPNTLAPSLTSTVMPAAGLLTVPVITGRKLDVSPSPTVPVSDEAAMAKAASALKLTGAATLKTCCVLKALT